MKKIIFFDVTGTLLYPKRTKNKENPGWPHQKSKNYFDARKHMTLTPHAKQTLIKLKKIGITLIIVSVVHDGVKQKDVEAMLKYFGIDHFFDEIHTVGKKVKGAKGPTVVSVLKRLKIPKKYALMVGDAYWADYRMVRDVGVESVLIYSEYQRGIRPNAWRVKKTIKDLSEIFRYVY
jgi:phosphoglycolate phosphatase-like HAD superfamily hydrolase